MRLELEIEKRALSASPSPHTETREKLYPEEEFQDATRTHTVEPLGEFSGEFVQVSHPPSVILVTFADALNVESKIVKKNIILIRKYPL
jgi:hypothetical protein